MVSAVPTAHNHLFWVLTSNPRLWRTQIPIRIGARADVDLSAAGGSGPAFGRVRLGPSVKDYLARACPDRAAYREASLQGGPRLDFLPARRGGVLFHQSLSRLFREKKNIKKSTMEVPERLHQRFLLLPHGLCLPRR